MSQNWSGGPNLQKGLNIGGSFVIDFVRGQKLQVRDTWWAKNCN